jgi:hypothetical protein
MNFHPSTGGLHTFSFIDKEGYMNFHPSTGGLYYHSQNLATVG